MKTRPIGEVFTVNKVKHIVVADDHLKEVTGCNVCAFMNRDCWRFIKKRGYCTFTERASQPGIHFELYKPKKS